MFHHPELAGSGVTLAVIVGGVVSMSTACVIAGFVVLLAESVAVQEIWCLPSPVTDRSSEAVVPDAAKLLTVRPERLSVQLMLVMALPPVDVSSAEAVPVTGAVTHQLFDPSGVPKSIDTDGASVSDVEQDGPATVVLITTSFELGLRFTVLPASKVTFPVKTLLTPHVSPALGAVTRTVVDAS
jgi:hypothetical protein